MICALTCESFERRLEIVKLLLSSSSDVNAADLNDNTPLIWAVNCSLKEIVELFIKLPKDKQLNISHQNDIGNTALHYSVCRA